MVHDLPDSIVLDEPDFLGLVVVLLFLVHKMERIRKWFTIDSNFKRPILNRADRAPMRQPKSRCVTFCAFMSDPQNMKEIKGSFRKLMVIIAARGSIVTVAAVVAPKCVPRGEPIGMIAVG
jgi:hypothetical protein